MLTRAQIEAAAQAIRDRVAGRGFKPKPWHALPKTLRQSYREEAIAALEAAEAVAEASSQDTM